LDEADTHMKPLGSCSNMQDAPLNLKGLADDDAADEGDGGNEYN
jgi:hypothetical protein